MSLIQHGLRVGLLMVGAACLFGWLTYHSEVTFADGLRYISQAEAIERGAWSQGLIRSVDHPLHPLAIAAAHRLIGTDGPVSWQRAAQVVAIGCCVLLVIPVYLVGLEVYGPTAAWLGCLLFLGNPQVGSVAVNVLSETSFLLFWTWGLWGAVRFLREGQFFWLPLTIGFAVLAYLSRPEGMLLPLAMVATLLVLPLHWSTRIYWPKWWAAVAFLVIGPVLLVGPYMAAKGGIGTKPSIARILGTAPKSAPDALERERPLPPDQTTFETYRLAIQRMFKVMRGSVTLALLPLVILGLATARPWSSWARVWIFTGLIVAASAVALVRLHATGGYCTVRHALVPGMLLTLAAANGVAWLMRSVVIPGQWLGRGDEQFRLGPAVWAVVLSAVVAVPYARAVTPAAGSFAAYRDAGVWIAQTKAHEPGKVLDMTNWSLYFSEQPGLKFADVHTAPRDPELRWIIVRDAHLRGRWNYSAILRHLIADREPVALFPAHPGARQLQLRIFDLRTTPLPAVIAAGPRDPQKGKADPRIAR